MLNSWKQLWNNIGMFLRSFLVHDNFEETNKCFEGSTHALPPYLRTRVLVIKNDTHPLLKIIFGYVRYMVYFLQIPLNAHQMLLAELKSDVPATRTYRDLNIFRMQKKGDYFRRD